MSDDHRDGQEQEEVPAEVVPPTGVFAMVTIRHDLPHVTALATAHGVYPAGTTRSQAYILTAAEAADRLGVDPAATSVTYFYCEADDVR